MFCSFCTSSSVIARTLREELPKRMRDVVVDFKGQLCRDQNDDCDLEPVGAFGVEDLHGG